MTRRTAEQALFRVFVTAAIKPSATCSGSRPGNLQDDPWEMARHASFMDSLDLAEDSNPCDVLKRRRAHAHRQAVAPGRASHGRGARATRRAAYLLDLLATATITRAIVMSPSEESRSGPVTDSTGTRGVRDSTTSIRSS
jgi:hypothetical protein